MAYIGKQGISSTTLTSKTLSTMVGNGSTDTLTLSPAPDSVNDVAIYLDGVFQTPGTEYTLAGSTITFTTAPANNVFVCAIVGGGEHIGTPMDNSIGTDKLVDGTLTNAKIDSVSTSKVSGTLPALNANAVTGLNAANLVGNMPAIDGSNLTGISSFTKNANDPAGNTNPAGGVGTIWANTTSGELYVLTDATTDANVWTNVGDGTGQQPVPTWSATGGSITTDGDYKVHSFTTSGTFNFNVTSVGTTPTVEYLVIAGGGGGGGGQGDVGGGGGGAGGYLTASNFTVTSQSYTVTVGVGGSAGGGPDYAPISANQGSNSIFGSITSTGGGYGARGQSGSGMAGGAGGSGGGGSTDYSSGTSVGAGGAASPAGQGNAGANSVGGNPYRSGGGGGASAAGSSDDGGNGLASDILVTGVDVIRAGGGGGSYRAGGGNGGSGGGGNGGHTSAVDGTANKGGGGGGIAQAGPNAPGNTAGAGGSGIVIIRYKFQ